MAEDKDLDTELAIQRARTWGPRIADTAMQLCSEQLESCIEFETP
jgi:hypothetical protein